MRNVFVVSYLATQIDVVYISEYLETSIGVSKSICLNGPETVLYLLWHCYGPLHTWAVETLKSRCGRRAEYLHEMNEIK